MFKTLQRQLSQASHGVARQQVHAPLRSLVADFAQRDGGTCGLLCHILVQLRGCSPFSISVNKINNLFGYDIWNVQITTRAANLPAGNTEQERAICATLRCTAA